MALRPAKTLPLTSILFLLLALLTPARACPQSCDCHMVIESSHVTCVNQSLTSVPGDIPSNVTHLHLRGNMISSLTNVFQQFTQVQLLDLSFNSLRTVIKGDFNTSVTLTDLHLSSNNISAVEDNSFTNLRNLRILNLANNSISSLNGAIFSGLLKLEQLYVQQNKIKVISKDTFAVLGTLTILDLSFNSIKEFPRATFQSLHNLTTLYLHHNHLQMFNGLDFPEANSLQHLNLSNNKLTQCANLTFPALTDLDVSWNNLQSLGSDMFIETENLTTLNLDGNPLSLMQSAVFTHLKSLNSLSMSFMPNLMYLSKDTFTGLENLHTLYVHNNPYLSFIHKQLFAPLVKVQTINISYNNIQVLLNSTFVHTTELSSLSVVGNVFTCDCSIEWLVADIQSNSSIIEQRDRLQCNSLSSNASVYLSAVDAELLQCTDVVIVNHSSDGQFKIGRSAILSCNAVSDPSPEITWVTPRNRVLTFHGYHDLAIQDYLPLNNQAAHKAYHSTHEWHEQPSYHSDSESRSDRLTVLEDGSLYIDYVMRSDGGPYKCIASNPRNSTQVVITLFIDTSIMTEVYIWSLIVGFSCAGSFFLLNLTYSLILFGVRRCISQRRRERIRQVVETMDHYKTTQLTRIKENYNHQVGRIRDQYHYQLGRIREHHQNQMTRMGRMREGASQKMDKLKENTNNRLTLLKEYSSSQLVQLREKYNSQIDRIKDYGSDKFDRIHEKYKLKQQHVINLLDMMNMDKCRTVFESECVRTESMILQSDVFVSETALHSPIDSVSVSDSEYMTATSTESSKYSSQHNITQGIEDGEDFDSALAPMNPYIPDDDGMLCASSIHAQTEETSFISEPLSIYAPAELQSNLNHSAKTDQPSARAKTSTPVKHWHPRSSHKHKRRHGPSLGEQSAESEQLYATDCDTTDKQNRQQKTVSDNIDNWSFLQDMNLVHNTKAVSDTFITGLRGQRKSRDEVSNPSRSESIASSRSTGPSSTPSRKQPISLTTVTNGPSVPNKPGALTRTTKGKTTAKVSDQVTIAMKTEDNTAGLTMTESHV